MLPSPKRRKKKPQIPNVTFFLGKDCTFLAFFRTAICNLIMFSIYDWTTRILNVTSDSDRHSPSLMEMISLQINLTGLKGTELVVQHGSYDFFLLLTAWGWFCHLPHSESRQVDCHLWKTKTPQPFKMFCFGTLAGWFLCVWHQQCFPLWKWWLTWRLQDGQR